MGPLECTECFALLLHFPAKGMQMFTSSCHHGLLLVSTFYRGKQQEGLLSDTKQGNGNIGNRAIGSKPSSSARFAGRDCRRLRLSDYLRNITHSKIDTI